MHYNILHVDDHDNIRATIERLSMKEGLTYFGVSSLDGWRSAIEEHTADLYLIDGMFPRSEGDATSLLTRQAILAVQERNPEAKFAVFSGEPAVKNIADKFDAVFMLKTEVSAAQIRKTLIDLVGGK